ncbi:hypothetical protein ACFWN7_13805 [Agromyces sp. NPDC058484]|uniref:hypothetical protein n=1 Tax=Agromyces sp. NPDC058484 TaxID=3346524 RepID=UPI00366A4404
MSRRSGASRSAFKVWTGVGVSLLAVIVVALSLLALTQNRSVEAAGSTPGAADPDATVAQATDPAEVPAPIAQTVAVPTRVLTAIDADSAVRAAVTACPAPSTVEVTDDAGASWEPFEAEGVSAVQQITADSDGFVALIGLASEDCAPSYERSFTDGADWQTAPDELSASWFVDPANRAAVHAPSGDRPAPCGAVVQLTVIDENSAALLCDDATVHATVDAGGTWLPPVAVPGAAAISAGADGYRVAVINQNGCVGAQVAGVTITDARLQADAAGVCLDATIAPGEAALAVGDDATWLWAGNALARSEDGGATWL